MMLSTKREIEFILFTENLGLVLCVRDFRPEGEGLPHTMTWISGPDPKRHGISKHQENRMAVLLAQSTYFSVVDRANSCFFES